MLLFVAAVVAIVSSLGAPLIPSLAEQLNVSLASAQWALTATLVVAAVASPVVGRLGDGRQRKRMIVGGLALVVLGGAMAAVASSLALLIVGRGLQGFGFALLPLTMAAAREALPRAQATRAIAALSVMGAAGVGLGYPLTGLIADHGGVAAAYWVGTGVSFLALVLAAWAIPTPKPGAGALGRLDLPGALLIGFGLVGLLVALDKGPLWGWGDPLTLSLMFVGLVLIAIWAFHELRTANPLVDLRLMRHRAVLTANVSGLLLGVAMYTSMIMMVQFVQQPTFGFGASIFVAGLTLVPMSVLSSATSRTLPWLEGRIGIRPIIPAGALAVAAAALFFALTMSSLWQAFVTMGVIGIGLGYTFAAMPGLIVGAVPSDQTSRAMGLYQVSRFVGAALGSGVAITILQLFGANGLPTLEGYRAAGLAGAALAVLTAVVAWVLPGRTELARSAELDAYEEQEGRLAVAGLENMSELLPTRSQPNPAESRTHPRTAV